MVQTYVRKTGAMEIYGGSGGIPSDGIPSVPRPLPPRGGIPSISTVISIVVEFHRERWNSIGISIEAMERCLAAIKRGFGVDPGLLLCAYTFTVSEYTPKTCNPTNHAVQEDSPTNAK